MIVGDQRAQVDPAVFIEHDAGQPRHARDIDQGRDPAPRAAVHFEQQVRAARDYARLCAVLGQGH